MGDIENNKKIEVKPDEIEIINGKVTIDNKLLVESIKTETLKLKNDLDRGIYLAFKSN